jgi:hypothetical protein
MELDAVIELDSLKTSKLIRPPYDHQQTASSLLPEASRH